MLAQRPARSSTFAWDGLRAAALIALVVAIYQPVWHAGFIWDDDAHLTKNICIVGPAGFKEIWTTSEATYYPLVLSTFWVLHRLWGLNPLPYHLANVFLHGLSAVLLWRVLLRLGVRGAWAGSALWAAHPVMVQSVAWVTELKNTQSCFFYLLCVLAYLRSRTEAGAPRSAHQLWWLGGALFFCALAITSKSSAVVLPAILALCIWWRDRRVRVRDFYELFPFFLIAALAGGWTIWEQKFHSGAAGAEWAHSLIERIAIAGYDVWFYLSKLLWPHPLVFIYPRWQIDPARLISFLPIGGVVFGLGWCWWHRQGKWRAVAFAGAYFLIALLPVLGFFDVYFFRYSFVSDHFQYLASIGPLALAGSALTTMGDRRPFSTVRSASFVIVLLTLATLAYRQTQLYSGATTLWQATLARNPKCWMAHYELARPLRERGELDGAIAEYEKGLAIWPDYAAAHYNLASVFLEKGDAHRAVDEYEIALRLDPADAETHNNLANVLGRQGKLAEAIAHYERAITLRPDYAAAELNLGNLFAAQNRAEAALTHFRRAAELASGDVELHLDLANAFLQTGHFEDAARQFEQTLRSTPDNVAALTNFTWLLATSPDPKLRNGARALQLGHRADQISGGTDALVLHALAGAMAETGDFAGAVTTAERAAQMARAQGDAPMADAIRAEVERYRAGIPSRSAASE